MKTYVELEDKGLIYLISSVEKRNIYNYGIKSLTLKNSVAVHLGLKIMTE